MDGELLTVQIRSPSMSETLTLTIQRDASVHSLKQQILSVHPKQPSVVDQRIIFSGKLLNDTDTLNRVLEKTDVNSIPTFHLVVKPTPVTNNTSSSSSSSPTTTSPYMNTRPSVPSPLSNVISAQNNNSSSSSQPQSSTTFESQQQSSFNQQPQQQDAMPGYPTLLPGGYQVIALNGQYYLAPVLVPAFTPQQQVPIQQQQQQQQHQQNFNHQFQPHIHTGVNGQQQHQQQPHLPHLPQQPQGGGVHIQGRIRATSIWLALKLIFILFILCQDASLERILFFHVVAFIFFLYQTGRLRFVIQRVRPEDLNRPQPHHPQQQPPAPQPQQPQQQPVPATNDNNNNNNNNNNNDNDNDNPPSAPTTPQPGNSNEQAGSSSGQQQQRQQQRPTTLLGTIKRGAYTFIASLWPNYGHDARIAQALNNGQNDWEGI